MILSRIHSLRHALCVIGLTGAFTSALAQERPQALTLPPAYAAHPLYQAQSNWGCEVLLCLSAKTPHEIEACRQPLDMLRKALSRGQPFPVCRLEDGANSQSAGAWAAPATNHYDRCPEDTSPLERDAYAMTISAAPILAASPGAAAPAVIFRGIGDGSGMVPTSESGAAGMPLLVCVGRFIETRLQWVSDAEGGMYISVGVYDQIAIQGANESGRVFEVYVDGKLYQRSRW